MTDKELDYMILQKENENLLKANKDIVREIEKRQSYFTGKVAESEIKAQAVKEFADRFEKKIKDVKFTLGETFEIQNALKDTLKEMVGDTE